MQIGLLSSNKYVLLSVYSKTSCLVDDTMKYASSGWGERDMHNTVCVDKFMTSTTDCIAGRLENSELQSVFVNLP